MNEYLQLGPFNLGLRATELGSLTFNIIVG